MKQPTKKEILEISWRCLLPQVPAVVEDADGIGIPSMGVFYRPEEGERKVLTIAGERVLPHTYWYYGYQVVIPSHDHWEPPTVDEVESGPYDSFAIAVKESVKEQLAADINNALDCLYEAMSEEEEI